MSNGLNYICVCLIAACFFSCKKDKKTETASGSHPLVTSGPNTSGDGYNGIIFITNEIQLGASNHNIVNEAGAFFYSEPKTGSELVHVGSVSVNGIQLKFLFLIANLPLYLDTTGAIGGQPYIVKAGGTSTYPGFEITSNERTPYLSDTALIPKQIDRGKDLVLSFTNLGHSDSLYVELKDTGTPITQTQRATVVNNKATVVFQAAHLQAFTGVNPVKLTVALYNGDKVTSGLRNYLFDFETSYIRENVKFF